MELPPSVPGPRKTTAAPVRLMNGELAAVLHAPAAGEVRHVGVICPPIFYEYQLCHRTLRALAERIASTGAWVLRLDYRGTGDSAGVPDAVGPETWAEDVRAGADYLTSLGRSVTFYFGLRVGASVALRHASKNGERRAAVLAWSPIINAPSFAAELQQTHDRWYGEYARHHRSGTDRTSRADRVLGSSWPAAARARLEAMSPPEPGSLSQPVTLIDTTGHALSDASRVRLERAAPRLNTLVVDGPAPWVQDPDIVSPAVPARGLETIVRHLSESGPA